MMAAFRKFASLFLCAALLLALCAQTGAEEAPAASREVADASQMTSVYILPRSIGEMCSISA